MYKRKIYDQLLHWKNTSNGKTAVLITEKNKICPIEVKSSGYKSHASIDAFSQKFSSKIIRKIMLYTKDYMRDGDMECIPVYMAQFL